MSLKSSLLVIFSIIFKKGFLKIVSKNVQGCFKVFGFRLIKKFVSNFITHLMKLEKRNEIKIAKKSANINNNDIQR